MFRNTLVVLGNKSALGKCESNTTTPRKGPQKDFATRVF
jgi:hypothetical protein